MHFRHISAKILPKKSETYSLLVLTVVCARQHIALEKPGSPVPLLCYALGHNQNINN